MELNPKPIGTIEWGKVKKYLLQFLAEGIIFMGYEAKPNCPWEDKVVCSLTVGLFPFVADTFNLNKFV